MKVGVKFEDESAEEEEQENEYQSELATQQNPIDLKPFENPANQIMQGTMVRSSIQKSDKNSVEFMGTRSQESFQDDILYQNQIQEVDKDED